MPGAGYSLSNQVASTAANKGQFGTNIFRGLNFAPLDAIPSAVFGGGGGTQSKTLMYVIGAGVVIVGVVAVFALKKR